MGRYDALRRELETFERWCKKVGGDVRGEDLSRTCDLPDDAGRVHMDQDGIEVHAESTDDVRVNTSGQTARQVNPRNGPPRTVQSFDYDKTTIYQPETLEIKGSTLSASSEMESLTIGVVKYPSEREMRRMPDRDSGGIDRSRSM